MLNVDLPVSFKWDYSCIEPAYVWGEVLIYYLPVVLLHWRSPADTICLGTGIGRMVLVWGRELSPPYSAFPRLGCGRIAYPKTNQIHPMFLSPRLLVDLGKTFDYYWQTSVILAILERLEKEACPSVALFSFSLDISSVFAMRMWNFQGMWHTSSVRQISKQKKHPSGHELITERSR